jgi:hypothetical protein
MTTQSSAIVEHISWVMASHSAVALLIEDAEYDAVVQRLSVHRDFTPGEVPRLASVPIIHYPLLGSWSVHAGQDGFPTIRCLQR